MQSLDPTQEDERKKLQAELKKREEVLSPIYHTVAVQFADLHDTAGRMLAKGVISVSFVVTKVFFTLEKFLFCFFFKKIIHWKTARQKFYWRLKRRLAEERINKLIRLHYPQLPDAAVSELLRRWFNKDTRNEVCFFRLFLKIL